MENSDLKNVRPEFSPTSCYYSPTSPSYSPTLPTYTWKTYPGSSANTGTFTFPGDEEWSVELRRRAKIALDYYNKKNSTEYELVDALDNKGIFCDGFWNHCNFTAKPPNGDKDGESSCKLFFSELVMISNAETTTWTANACHILDGKTTDGCKFCSGLIHPTHGFSQGISRVRTSMYSPGNTVPSALPCAEKRDRRAVIALEYYNRENGTSYELLDVYASKSFLANGTWYHYNFMAKQDVDGKYTCSIFFAEILIIYHPAMEMETLTVTACLIMEAQKIEGGCYMCSDVIHPTYGFLQGLHELKHLYPPTSPSPTSPMYTWERYLNSSVLGSSFPSDKELWSDNLRTCAKIALEYYNKRNATDYELVDVLDSKGKFRDGFSLHCNFTAKLQNGDISSKLFFAEILGLVDTYNSDVTWTANACHILDGETTDSCTFCSGIIHPTYGYSEGIIVPSADAEEYRRRAEIALEYYNEKNSTSYELVDVTTLSNGLLLQLYGQAGRGWQILPQGLFC